MSKYLFLQYLQHGSKRYFPVPVHVLSSHPFSLVQAWSFPNNVQCRRSMHPCFFYNCCRMYVAKIVEEGLKECHAHGRWVGIGFILNVPVFTPPANTKKCKYENGFSCRRIERNPRSWPLCRNWPILSLILLVLLSVWQVAACLV
jgi:hypothetical protein